MYFLCVNLIDDFFLIKFEFDVQTNIEKKINIDPGLTSKFK